MVKWSVLIFALFVISTSNGQSKLSLEADIIGGFGYSSNTTVWNSGGVFNASGQLGDEIEFKKKGQNINAAFVIGLGFGRFSLGPIVGFRSINSDSLKTKDGSWKLYPIMKNVSYFGLHVKYHLLTLNKNTTLSPVIEFGTFGLRTNRSYSKEDFQRKIFVVLALAMYRDLGKFNLLIKPNYNLYACNYVVGQKYKVYEIRTSSFNIDIGFQFKLR